MGKYSRYGEIGDVLFQSEKDLYCPSLEKSTYGSVSAGGKERVQRFPLDSVFKITAISNDKHFENAVLAA